MTLWEPALAFALIIFGAGYIAGMAYKQRQLNALLDKMQQMRDAGDKFKGPRDRIDKFDDFTADMMQRLAQQQDKGQHDKGNSQ